ncbi:hypothetical protein LQW54_001095 [Pestalotiopsis sp. IQ-011]
MDLTADKGPTIIGIAIMFEVFAVISLLLRVWSQKILRRKFFAHDVLVLIGFTLATAVTTCLIISVVHGGLGKHTIALADESWRLVLFGKLLIVIQILWAFGMTCIRMSILGLYVHIFSAQKTFRCACYVVMVICVLWLIADTCIVFLLCQPLAYLWDNSTPGGHCGNIPSAYLAANGSNFGIDSTIALLPIYPLWQLQLPVKKKLGIIAIFSLGALICSISIARVIMYRQALAYGQSDFTYSGSTLYIFTVIEPLLSCSIACLPLLGPAAEKVSAVGKVSWLKSFGSLASKHDTSHATAGRSSFGNAITRTDEYSVGHQDTTGAHRQWQRVSSGSSRDDEAEPDYHQHHYEMAQNV